MTINSFFLIKCITIEYNHESWLKNFSAIFVVLSAVVPSGYEPEESVCSPEDQGQNLMPFLIALNSVLVIYLPFFTYFFKCDYKRKRFYEVTENDL